LGKGIISIVNFHAAFRAAYRVVHVSLWVAELTAAQARACEDHFCDTID
jgi:hypothetical protein